MSTIAIGWGVGVVVDMGTSNWCDKAKGVSKISPKGHLHLEHPWYPTYGLFARCQIKGYMTCPLCGPNVDTRGSSHLKKNVYLGHHHYLAKHHPYRRNWVNFNGLVEHRPTPIWVPLVDFPRRIEEKEEWLNRRKVRPAGDKDDHVHVYGVKRKVAL